MAGYNITKEGYDWGRLSKDQGANTTGFDENTMFHTCSVLFSDKFLGSFLVPAENSWNYNFRGSQFRANDPYDVVPDVPKEYYDPVGEGRGMGLMGRCIARSISRTSVTSSRTDRRASSKRM